MIAPVDDPIFDAVIEAMQPAEDLGGPNGDDYVALMAAIASEALRRIGTYAARDAVSVVPDGDLAKGLPKHHGWIPSFEYPGQIHYTHPEIDVFVVCTSDWEGDIDTLDVQIQNADGSFVEDIIGDTLRWPRKGRTSEAMFDLLRPILDEILAESGHHCDCCVR